MADGESSNTTGCSNGAELMGHMTKQDRCVKDEVVRGRYSNQLSKGTLEATSTLCYPEVVRVQVAAEIYGEAKGSG